MVERLSAKLLLIWWVLNSLPGIGSLIHIGLGKNAPAFQMNFSPEEISSLENRVLNTTNGIAVIANTLIIVVCLMGAFLTFRVWRDRDRNGYFALVGSVTLIQLASIWSDTYFSGQNTAIIATSTVLFVLGLTGLGRVIFRR